MDDKVKLLEKILLSHMGKYSLGCWVLGLFCFSSKTHVYLHIKSHCVKFDASCVCCHNWKSEHCYQFGCADPSHDSSSSQSALAKLAVPERVCRLREDLGAMLSDLPLSRILWFGLLGCPGSKRTESFHSSDPAPGFASRPSIPPHCVRDRKLAWITRTEARIIPPNWNGLN